MDHSTPGLPVFHCLPSSTASQSLVKVMLVALMTLSNHIILCHPLLLPSHFPNIRSFPGSLLMRWPKYLYWNLSFRICPSSEYSGLISFKMDGFVLLAVQGTFKSLLQHHNSKASNLRWSALWSSSHFPYIVTGKTSTAST